MEIHVDFDLILIAIFITIFITGYIRGAGIELLRVLKVIIPFFVLYFYGDKINDLLFSSPKIVDFVYRILPNVPYRNTLAAISSQIAVYITVYLFLAIFLWRLGKYVLDERIEFLFGRFNSILGGIFSFIRMYIIVSVIIIPFYALNFTNYSDPLTSLVLNNPPNFSRIGLLINKIKPTVDQINKVSSSFKIMDLASLEKYTNLLLDVKEFIIYNENEAYKIYNELQKEKYFSKDLSKSEFMIYYLENYDEFKNHKFNNQEISQVNKNMLEVVDKYPQVFTWAYENNVLEIESNKEIIRSFIDNYPNLVADMDDDLTIEIFEKLRLNTLIYLTVKDWLYYSYQIELKDGLDILNNEYLEVILEDFLLHKEALILAFNNSKENKDIKDNEYEMIIKQIDNLSNFHQEYISKYKPQIKLYDQIFDDVSFKYKLIFAIMKDKKFSQIVDYEIDNNSLSYYFLLDSLDFINRFNKGNNKIYYEALQIYISLFLIDIDEDNQISIMTYDNFLSHLKRFSENKELFRRTKEDLNKIINALLVERENGSYLEYLIDSGLCEANIIDKLIASDDIKEIFTEENYLILEELS